MQTRAKARREFAETRARTEARQQVEMDREQIRRARYGHAGHHTQFATEAEAMYGEPLHLVSPYSFMFDLGPLGALWSKLGTTPSLPLRPKPCMVSLCSLFLLTLSCLIEAP